MSNYQAVYDAVLKQFDISWQIARASEILNLVEEQALRPSTRMRPSLSIDGNQWCALYGDNLQDGVAGFGDTPEAAFRDFDKAWHTPLPIKETNT